MTAVFILNTTPVCALMPPDAYSEQISASPVKITAVVEKIDELGPAGKPPHAIRKKAVFKVERIFEGKPGEICTGTFLTHGKNFSVQWLGPQIYYDELSLHERVFVAISEKGEITCCVDLSPEIEKALTNTPGKLRVFGSGLYLETADNKACVFEGKEKHIIDKQSNTHRLFNDLEIN